LIHKAGSYLAYRLVRRTTLFYCWLLGRCRAIIIGWIQVERVGTPFLYFCWLYTTSNSHSCTVP